MRIFRPATILLSAMALAGTLPGLSWPASAGAGEYTVRQCLGADFRGFSGEALLLNGIDRVDFGTSCTGTPSQTGVYQDRSGRGMGEGVGGEYRWTAPDEARIVATRFVVKMKQANGILSTPVGWWPEGGQGLILDGGQPRDGSQVTATWSDRARPLSWVSTRLVCRRENACANRPDVVKAFIAVYDTEFTLRDQTPPSVAPGGVLWGWGEGGWHRDSAELRAVAADDGGGVSRVWAEVNGIGRNIGTVSCPGSVTAYATSTAPCPRIVTQTQALNTASSPFREGLNLVRTCAEDFRTGSGEPNRTCGSIRTVRIDNVAPDPPVSLRTIGGEDWRAENGFEFAWNDPGGQMAPITGGRYRLADLATGEVVAEADFQSPVGRLGPLKVPAPGEYLVTVSLRDAAGNLGAPASAVARFDDRPPGDVSPEPQPGWVSGDELPLRQVVERAEVRGLSGIGGYALAVAQAGPATPCPSGLCLAPQFALTGGIDDRVGSIPGLAEGSHWVSAVATSGASVSSLTPGSTVVRVDRTAPRVNLAGIPGGWANHAVTVTATATDALSGMSARPGEDDGTPETVIQPAGQAPYRVPGGAATFTVTAEGENLVRYWARDLAGNESDGERGPDGSRHSPPGEAVVRIDTVPPDFTFVRPRDPRDPERIEVVGTDAGSGPAKAVISFRRAGTADPFTTLDTSEGAGGRYAARIPSDRLSGGSYELQVIGTDHAGNPGRGDRAGDGLPMLLRLPLKQPTVLNAGFGRQSRPKVRTAFRSRPLLHGTLASQRARLSGEVITVVERFDAGSHPARRRSRVRTDGTGRFALRLRPGPSRQVEVLYGGTRTRSAATAGKLRVRSAGKITLGLNPPKLLNGGRVRMSGRVARSGALVPAGGKLVAIQFYDPSRGRWRPVEVLRTRRNGRFAYRYRFRTIASAQRILFRAVALPEAGWPYLHSTSGRKSVIVFPRH